MAIHSSSPEPFCHQAVEPGGIITAGSYWQVDSLSSSQEMRGTGAFLCGRKRSEGKLAV